MGNETYNVTTWSNRLELHKLHCCFAYMTFVVRCIESCRILVNKARKQCNHMCYEMHCILYKWLRNKSLFWMDENILITEEEQIISNSRDEFPFHFQYLLNSVPAGRNWHVLPSGNTL